MGKQEGKKPPRQIALQLGASEETHAWAARAVKEVVRRSAIALASRLEREALELRTQLQAQRRPDK